MIALQAESKENHCLTAPLGFTNRWNGREWFGPGCGLSIIIGAFNSVRGFATAWGVYGTHALDGARRIVQEAEDRYMV